MTIRIMEDTGHLWLHDRGDGLDHAMPRRHLIEATRQRAGTCRAACGHQVRSQNGSDVTGDDCRTCASIAPHPTLWQRLTGRSA